MKKLNLEFMAMRWLWIERKCHYVIEQRSPKPMSGSPDVIGITEGRHLIEIEIKRSLSDFYADSRKWHRANREHYLKHQPRQFYYLFPREIADRALDKIPEWAGLMRSSVSEFTVEVVRIAPVNKSAERLSLKQCCKAARQMVAHMMGKALLVHRLESQYINGKCDYSDFAWDKSVGFWEI